MLCLDARRVQICVLPLSSSSMSCFLRDGYKVLFYTPSSKYTGRVDDLKAGVMHVFSGSHGKQEGKTQDLCWRCSSGLSVKLECQVLTWIQEHEHLKRHKQQQLPWILNGLVNGVIITTWARMSTTVSWSPEFYWGIWWEVKNMVSGV